MSTFFEVNICWAGGGGGVGWGGWGVRTLQRGKDWGCSGLQSFCVSHISIKEEFREALTLPHQSFLKYNSSYIERTF